MHHASRAVSCKLIYLLPACEYVWLCGLGCFSSTAYNQAEPAKLMALCIYLACQLISFCAVLHAHSIARGGYVYIAARTPTSLLMQKSGSYIMLYKLLICASLPLILAERQVITCCPVVIGYFEWLVACAMYYLYQRSDSYINSYMFAKLPIWHYRHQHAQQNYGILCF